MDDTAVAYTESLLDPLVERSRLLGADRSVCNWGGGNTSTKMTLIDHAGRSKRIMWLKGSGSDLATVSARSFTGLRLDEVIPLQERERLSDGDSVLAKAAAFVEGRAASRPAFGGARCEAVPPQERRALVSALLARGLCSQKNRNVLLYDDAPDVLAFANSVDGPRLANIGEACLDQLVHTKARPLFVDWAPGDGAETLVERVRAGVTAFAHAYQRYLDDNAEQHLDPDAEQPVSRAANAYIDPAPRIVLIPGLGMIATGKDSQHARIAAGLYHRAAAVIRGAEACGGFVSLTDAESVLGVNILPADIAEAVAFLASPTRSTKSTGNILNVDGGVTAAYTR